ncbi:hypothetical protein PANDA_022223, partial [Ailuropoda melanoleuca]
MEFPSAPPQRGHVPWQDLLLAGASLRLSCHAASNPPARYSWLINGRPQPSTQELFIPNLTANDSGAYTCIASNSGTRLNKTTVQTITVSEPVAQPFVQANNTIVTEHKDSVVLTCSTHNPGVSIHWFFNGQSLKLMERLKLSQDNSTLTIDPVRREDAGNCSVRSPTWPCSSQQLHIPGKLSPSTTLPTGVQAVQGEGRDSLPSPTTAIPIYQ